MKSVAFFNNKGGVGKTTLLCNLAAYISINEKKRVLVVDADPQCNATQMVFSDSEIEDLYGGSGKAFTINKLIEPISQGRGYAPDAEVFRRDEFNFDILIGDPKLSLMEDLLAKDWGSSLGGDIRGLRTNYVFRDMLSKFNDYDYVFFDMGPSLGSINRAALLASDYFITPMSIDIFSLRAIENIQIALEKWRKQISTAHQQVEADDQSDFGELGNGFNIAFAGYVTQQYIAKQKDGVRRAVAAYEKIYRKVDPTIRKCFGSDLSLIKDDINYLLGTVPNLHSLISLSQFAHKPIFELKAKDGVRGAHFSKVKDAEKIYREISQNLITNIEHLGASG
ncbi:MAG: ParA family protein [Glycocaulis sp.]